jgi:signal transduction histidine kinase
VAETVNQALRVGEHCPLANELAERLREGRKALTRQWLDRVTARVEMVPERVFPTRELLDHVPLLLEGIANYVENPADEISGDMPLVGKAMELGKLRYEQGFDAHEILKEYEILGGVLFTFLTSVVDDIPKPCSRGELLSCGHRIFRAVAIIEQLTTSHYLRVMREQVRERENRLRGFNRLVSHELKNRIGAILNAGDLLSEGWPDPEQRAKFARITTENARGLQQLVENLTELSRLESPAPAQRDLPLRNAVAEAVRQLRQLAEERGVEVRMAEDLPDIHVNAAVVELCTANYLSNAIKYSDPTKAERFAEIRARVVRRKRPAGREVIVEVRDNGVGVPEAARTHMFERFFRSDQATVTGQEGTGLGLSIVREAVEALGGRAWATFRDDGSTFAFALPLEGPDRTQAVTD